MAEKIKKLDQQRHELKALRYLLESHPDSVRNRGDPPSREDFQIEENQLIFDVLLQATSKEDAIRAIEDLDLEETEVESFLRLSGQFYHGYPQIVKERGQEFREGKLQVVDPGEWG